MNHLAPTMGPSITPSRSHGRAWGLLALWSAAALAFSISGALGALPRPMIPALIWTPVIACVVAYRRGGSLRALVRDVDLRAPVLFHVVRIFFGAAFLLEMSAGRLPAAFARVAGPGDIVAGALALPAAYLASRADPRARALVLAWNALGLADILAVFLTAQRLLFLEGDATMVRAFSRFPYAALPTLVVPLVILTHLAVFARLRARDGAQSRSKRA